ncbi:MAG: phosphoglycerate kinase [Candidatus Aenigmarchaeota archaeon]|nr:phosphoglycerate kinase [Candidatus Aenigmarchaeota archaeon]
MEKQEVDFENAVVFDKVDINSSVDWDQEHIRDLGKIEQAVESINFAFDHGARCVVIASHQGDAGKNESLKLHADALQKLLPEHRVLFAGVRSGDKAREMIENAKPGEVIVLENTRTESEEWEHLHPKETKLYKTFAGIDNIAAIKDDPASHRKELSSYGLLKQFAEDGKFVTIGPNFIREAKKAENAEKILLEKHSYAILGGRKFSDLVEITPQLLKKFPKMDVLVAGLFGIYLDHINGVPMGENKKHIDKEHARALKASSDGIWGCNEKRLFEFINSNFNGFFRERVSLPHDYHIHLDSKPVNMPKHDIHKGPVVDIGLNTIKAFQEKISSKKEGVVLISGSTGYYEIAKDKKDPGLLGAVEVYSAAFDPKNGHYSIVIGGDASALLNSLDMNPQMKSSAGKAFIKRLIHGPFYDCDFVKHTW